MQVACETIEFISEEDNNPIGLMNFMVETTLPNNARLVSISDKTWIKTSEGDYVYGNKLTFTWTEER